MKSKVIIFCVLLFCSKFVASSPFNEDSARQWQGSQNTAENYQGTGFARTQNINSMTNSAQYANSQEYNANQGSQIYDNYGFNNQATPLQTLPVKDTVNFASDNVQSYPIRTDNNPIRLNNPQYTQQLWQQQNRFGNSASNSNRGYVNGYNRPLIPAQQAPRPFINGPSQPIQYLPNHQHLHYHPVAENSGPRPGPIRYENYNEPHVVASNINRGPGSNGYRGNSPPYNYNGAIPANASPNNGNAGYREGPVVNPGPNYPIQNTYNIPAAPPNLPPVNNGAPQNIVPINKYPGSNNPAINNYNGAPILSNPNGGPSIPSNNNNGNPIIPIDKTSDSYKNPGDSANPGPTANSNSHTNLYQHYSTAANQGNIDDFLASSKLQDLLTDRKNRYLIIHPNGTVDYIDKLDDISLKYPNYIVVNKNNTTTAIPKQQPSNSPPAVAKPIPDILGPLLNNKTDSSPQSGPAPASNNNIPLFPSNFNNQTQQGPMTNNSSPGTVPPNSGYNNYPYNPIWGKNVSPSNQPTPLFTTTTSPPTPDPEALKDFLDSIPNNSDNGQATGPVVPSGTNNDNDKIANTPTEAPTTMSISQQDLLIKNFLDSLNNQPDDQSSNNDNANNNTADNQDNSSATTPSSKDPNPTDVTISPIETTTDQIITLSPIETATDNVRDDTPPSSDQNGYSNSQSSSKANANANSGNNTTPCPYKANQQKVYANNDSTTSTDDNNKKTTGNEDGKDNGTIILSINTPNSQSKNSSSTNSDDDDSTDNGFDKNKSHVIDLLNSVVVCSTTNSTDILNKMNANNSSCNVMYVIQMAPPNQPRVEKNKETTYFANGTVIEEYTETTWQDDDTPVIVTTKKVYHRDPVH